MIDIIILRYLLYYTIIQPPTPLTSHNIKFLSLLHNNIKSLRSLSHNIKSFLSLSSTYPPSQFFILFLVIILLALMKVLRRVKRKSLYTTYVAIYIIQPCTHRLLFCSNHPLWSVINYIKNHTKICTPVLANILFKNDIKIW